MLVPSIWVGVELACKITGDSGNLNFLLNFLFHPWEDSTLGFKTVEVLPICKVKLGLRLGVIFISRCVLAPPFLLINNIGGFFIEF